MKLAQIRNGNIIECMLAEDWEVYKNSQYSKDCTICEYTKTGKVKKGSEYKNNGVTFIKYIEFSDLYIDTKARETKENTHARLQKIHDRIVKDNGITFNYASHGWLPRGMTKKEGATQAKISKKMDKFMENEYNKIAHRIPKANETIIKNLTTNKYSEIR